MIDIKWLREQPQLFRDAARDKRFSVDIDRLLEVDARLVEMTRELQDVRTRQNQAGKEIARLKGDEKTAAIADMQQLKDRAKQLEGEIDELQQEFDRQMLLVPQPPDEEVPLGKDDTENVELRRVGEIRSMDFEPRDHVELGKALGIIDVERGVKLAGSRNYVLRGAGAMMHQAVLRLAVDLLVGRGYELLTVPVLVNEEVMYGTGYFPVGRDQAYLCERDNMSLVGTSEVSLTAYHCGEILAAADLPRKYVAMSTCFRREAGAAGKDTYGLYRVHYFDKVEQVIVAPNDKDLSRQLHQEILQNSEDLLGALELPYRVVNVCSGDLGQGQVQKFDVETWMPSRGSYGETHSASRFYEFQARRLDLRYRDAEGRVRYCHTLNNTVVASPRILIPILELYQNADGSVTVPRALRPYMHDLDRIGPA